MMDPQWVIAGATCVATLAGVVTAVVGLYQLNDVRKSVRSSSLANVLQLESEMDARKVKVDETASTIRKIEATGGDDKLIEIYGDELDSYIENWLNAVDRLAYCVLKGYWAERDWRAEYRPYIASIITTHESRFGAGTPYTNIFDLHQRWKRD